MTYPPSKVKCRGCGYPITWAAQWQQFGRLLKRGFTPDQAKQAMPRCQKCTTRWLRESSIGRLWLMANQGGARQAQTAAAAKRFDVAYETAKQAVSVCKAFESCRRLQHLTWQHHQEVAGRPDADDLLQWAVEAAAAAGPSPPQR